MKVIPKEPLVHFLILGTALYVTFSFLAEREPVRENQIVVSAGKIEHLATMFARTWQRPPTSAELKGLIDDFVREEVAYREGMGAGLDRDDTIIRRRIRQKLEFIAEDIANLGEPTGDDLAAYMAAHPDEFRIDSNLTFRQVYLNPEKRSDSLEADTHELLADLKSKRAIDASALGDRTLLDHLYADIRSRDIARLFGEEFAAAVLEFEPGAWHGPIESSYGVHLVFVDQRTESRMPALDDVRPRVRREWENARRVEAIEEFYRNLLQKYEVVIEWPTVDEEVDKR
jgi:hypothetical protein